MHKTKSKIILITYFQYVNKLIIIMLCTYCNIFLLKYDFIICNFVYKIFC